MATLTYVYATSTAVVGPLATAPEPHLYDLCEAHARSLTAPRGWELVRSGRDRGLGPPPAVPDDLVALAEAVRETTPPTPPSGPSVSDPSAPGAQRSHLRLVHPPPG